MVLTVIAPHPTRGVFKRRPIPTRTWVWTWLWAILFSVCSALPGRAQFGSPPRIRPRPVIVDLHVRVLRERQALPLHDERVRLALFQPLRIEVEGHGPVEVRPLSLERRRWLRLEVTDANGQRRGTKIRLRGSEEVRAGEIEAPLHAPDLRLHLIAEVRR